MWRVVLKWRASVDRALAPLGLTHAQYSLLASLYGISRAGLRPSQRELADFSGLEPIYISKLARVLEQIGLLERDTNPADPRAVQLRLTPRGRKVVAAAMGIVRALEDELLAPIGGRSSRRSAGLQDALQALLRDAGGVPLPESQKTASAHRGAPRSGPADRSNRQRRQRS
jgi:DNA-binding MarR family transcriptional regulator